MRILLVNAPALIRARSCGTVERATVPSGAPTPVPRISAEHEQQVRERIIRAAIEVFAEKGYHRATIADVVRRTGLSVGAIYTYFANKDALFLSSCDLVNDQAMEELGLRLAPLTTTEARLHAAIDYYVETVDTFDGGPGQAPLVAAWAE